MPVVRRERHRSNSNSPKLPSRTLSPRNAAAGHRFLLQTGSVETMPAAAKILPSSSSSRAAGTGGEVFAPARNTGINNNLSASPANSSASSSGSSSPVTSRPSISSAFPASLPLGMSLRNHSRNILAEQQQSRVAREDLLTGRRNRSSGFLDSDYPSGASSSNPDLTTRSAAGTRQMYTSQSTSSLSSSSSANNHNLTASSRSDPCIRLLADLPPDDFSDEKQSPRRKRRRLMDMIDTNVPQSHPGLWNDLFNPHFVDQLSPPLPPPVSSSSSFISRAPSRLSSSSSSSGDGGATSSSHRPRRLSSRKRADRRADFQNSIYSLNGHMVSAAPGMPYPPPFNAFCQANALGHACSANHVHMNSTGSMSAVPHLCCNVTMCPIQRGCPAAGHGAGAAPYGMAYSTASQQQQMHTNTAQSRHSQAISQSMSSQPHRTSQPYLPSDMLPGSHPYRTSYGHMVAPSMDQNPHRLSHHGSMPPHGLTSSARQYSSGSVGHQTTPDPMTGMYGLASEMVAASQAGSWAPRQRRMAENVTPASHLSQQNSAGRMNPGVAFQNPYEFYTQHAARYHALRSNQNSLTVGGPGYSYGPQMDMTGSTSHDPEHYEIFINLADRLGEGKPKGLSKPEIEKIRLRRFSGEKSEHGQVQCVICICDFEPKQNLRQLPCFHEFHAKCVDKWLKSNRTCPICRGDASACLKKLKMH